MRVASSSLAASTRKEGQYERSDPCHGLRHDCDNACFGLLQSLAWRMGLSGDGMAFAAYLD